LGLYKELPKDFSVAEFEPAGKRKMWTYATVGMSESLEEKGVELHLFSPNQQVELHVELLTIITHYHLTGSHLNLHHTVDFGRPWLPDSDCRYGLISLPYLDGPKLEKFQFEKNEVHCYWLVPITKKELDFAKEKGVEALEGAFEASKFNYLDSSRPSVI
jgi:hypothetical protein